MSDIDKMSRVDAVKAIECIMKEKGLIPLDYSECSGDDDSGCSGDSKPSPVKRTTLQQANHGYDSPKLPWNKCGGCICELDPDQAYERYYLSHYGNFAAVKEYVVCGDKSSKDRRCHENYLNGKWSCKLCPEQIPYMFMPKSEYELEKDKCHLCTRCTKLRELKNNGNMGYYPKGSSLRLYNDRPNWSNPCPSFPSELTKLKNTGDINYFPKGGSLRST